MDKVQTSTHMLHHTTINEHLKNIITMMKPTFLSTSYLKTNNSSQVANVEKEKR